MHIILTLLKGDTKNLKRDIVFATTIIAPILLTMVLKFGVPFVTLVLHKRLSFDLTYYYPLIIGVVLMLVPMLVGCMSGFILLEDKDEKMLMYYAVTPLSKEGYLIYRILSLILINFILSIFLIYFSNMVKISFLRLIPIVFIASIQAVIVALFLGAFGENRVDGLAITKALGVFYVVPIVDELVHFNFKWILTIFPTYWIPKAVEAVVHSTNYFNVILGGIMVHIIYFYLLYKSFEKKVLAS